MRALPPLAAFLLLATEAVAACPSPSTTADLASALDAAQSRYAAADLEGFEEAVERARAAVPCLGEPVARDLAARLHRTEGLRAFVARDVEGATRAFAAARAIEPAWRFPDTLAPPGHPIHAQYAAIDVALGAFQTVPTPAQGYLQFDGRTSDQRPTSWPTVAQRFDGEGGVVQTAWLGPDDPLFDYPARPPSAPELPSAPEPLPSAPRPRGPNRPLLYGAVGGLVASGALYGLAVQQHGVYHGEGLGPDDLDPARARVNGLVVASGAAAGLALAAGTGAFLVGRW